MKGKTVNGQDFFLTIDLREGGHFLNWQGIFIKFGCKENCSHAVFDEKNCIRLIGRDMNFQALDIMGGDMREGQRIFWFFAHQGKNQQFKLMKDGTISHIDDDNWKIGISNIDFSNEQNLVLVRPHDNRV